MARIHLGGELFALVDDEDIATVAPYNWKPLPTDGTVYARARKTWKGKTSGILMHRLLLDAPKGTRVEHINGNGLDNRRRNLRYFPPPKS